MYETVDNEKQNVDMQLHTAKFEISFEETKNLRVADVLRFYEQMGLELLHQQEKRLIEVMNESCEAIGNTVDATKHDNLSTAFLEVLRTMQIDFDEIRDRPRLPTLVLNPITRIQLEKRLGEMSSAELEQHEAERQSILDAKFQEYLLREGNRKLVD